MSLMRRRKEDDRRSPSAPARVALSANQQNPTWLALLLATVLVLLVLLYLSVVARGGRRPGTAQRPSTRARAARGGERGRARAFARHVSPRGSAAWGASDSQNLARLP